MDVRCECYSYVDRSNGKLVNVRKYHVDGDSYYLEQVPDSSCGYYYSVFSLTRDPKAIRTLVFIDGMINWGSNSSVEQAEARLFEALRHPLNVYVIKA